MLLLLGKAAEPKIFAVTDTDVGALLAGVGAALLLVDAVTGGGLWGTTYGGTRPQPKERFSHAAEVVGSLLVAAGSALLLFGSNGLTARVVLATLGATAIAVYLAMTKALHDHIALVHKEGNGPPHGWAWCLSHPLWKPPKP